MNDDTEQATPAPRRHIVLAGSEFIAHDIATRVWGWAAERDVGITDGRLYQWRIEPGVYAEYKPAACMLRGLKNLVLHLGPGWQGAADAEIYYVEQLVNAGRAQIGMDYHCMFRKQAIQAEPWKRKRAADLSAPSEAQVQDATGAAEPDAAPDPQAELDL